MVGRSAAPPPLPALAVLAMLATIVVGLAATAVVAGDTFAAGVPPAARVTIAGGHASPTWALHLLVAQEWACKVPPAIASVPCTADVAAALGTIHLRLAIGAGTTAVVAFAIALVASAGRQRRPPTGSRKQRFHFTLGKSTGTLARLGHGAGIAAGAEVVLAGDDVCQNTVIFGGIGSGKTTSIFNRLVRQAFRQNCGALIYSVKGDYADTARRIAAEEGCELTTLGPGAVPCNLLAGLTPETAASFMKSVVLLTMGANDAASVYVETATQLAGNLLGVLSFSPARYSLAGLREVVYDQRAMKALIEETEASIYDDAALERFHSYSTYITDIYHRSEPKIKNGAKTTLSTILDCFKLPEIRDAFCVASPDSVSMQGVLDGAKYVLELPLAQYGQSAATIYTFVRLRMFNVIMRRPSEPTWNQTRPVGFFCDEFQEIVAVADDALSDRNFWDKSRSARCFGVISAQGYASFEAKIGSKSLTDALLQNFRQKVCFQSEDPTTIKNMVELAGKVDVTRRARTQSRASSVNPGGSAASSTAANQDRSMAEYVIDAQLWRSVLKRGRALCLLSIDGEAYDDVLTMAYDNPK